MRHCRFTLATHGLVIMAEFLRAQYIAPTQWRPVSLGWINVSPAVTLERLLVFARS